MTHTFRLPLGTEQEYLLLQVNGQLGHYPDIVRHQHLINLRLERETNPVLVEMGQGIDATPQAVAENLRKRRKALRIVSEASGQIPVPAGTFPTFDMLAAPEYKDANPRYRQLREQYGDYQCNSTCGMHVHVGLDHFVRDNLHELLIILQEPVQQLREQRHRLSNKIEEIIQRLTKQEGEIPFVLRGSDEDLVTFVLQDLLVREMGNHAWVLQVISSNSPFLNGQHRGRINERLRYMQRMPVHGLMSFSDTTEHFATIIESMWRGLILNAKEYWWSIRSHPFLPTVENRMCDMPLVDDDAVAIVALIQVLIAWLLRRLMERGLHEFGGLPLIINKRNITETALHGLSGFVVDALAPHEKRVPVLEAIQRLIAHIRSEAVLLGSASYLDYIQCEICERGSASYLQLGWAQQAGGSPEGASHKLIEASSLRLQGRAPDWSPAREYMENLRRRG
jgi:gamma-glutamyl:cysteine ligase YbdK (ATP-grasp superfamily)